MEYLIHSHYHVYCNEKWDSQLVPWVLEDQILLKNKQNIYICNIKRKLVVI